MVWGGGKLVGVNLPEYLDLLAIRLSVMLLDAR